MTVIALAGARLYTLVGPEKGRRRAGYDAGKGILMKNFLTIGLITIAIMVLALASFASAPPGDNDFAVVDIPDKTKLAKAELQGKYIFVHDDSKMAKGEACLYVYSYSVDQNGKPEARPENLVVSFHCEPTERPKATETVLTYAMAANGSFELREIQFTGSSKGHRVP